MKKPVNLRLPVLYAAVLSAGILFSTLAKYFGFDTVWLFLPVGLMLCSSIITGVIYKKPYPVFVLFSAAAVFAIGALYTAVLIFNYCDTEVYIDSAVRVLGTVKEAGLTSKGTRFIVIDNVTFGDTPVKGRLVAYFLENAGDYCRRGYNVSFYSQPELLPFISQGTVNYNAAQGIKYYCIVAGGLQSHYAFSLFGEIAYAIENLLYDNTGGETASVAIALLTGNSDMISSGTIAAFRGGGIAHVFAVSGLHVGVVYGILTFVLKKTPLNAYLSAAIRIIFIFLFAGVCNFTPSSLRAAVMCSVTALASCLHSRYDSLNGISIAAIVILLINPLSMFEAGFALSFGAATGIILLYHNFYRILSFIPPKVRSGVASGWSAQFATIPVLLSSFGYISWAGIILNLVFIPLISAFYVLLFASTVLCLIFPFCAPVLMYVSATPLEFLINVIVSSGLDNAIISGSFGYWIFIPFIVFGVALSDKFNLTLRARGVIAGLTLTAVVCSATVPPYGKGSSVSFAAGYKGGYATVNNSQGSVLIVTQNVEGVPEYVLENSDVLVIVGDDEVLAAMIDLDGSFGKVYLRGSSAYVPPLGDYNVEYCDSFTECGIEFEYEGNALYFQSDGVRFAFAFADKGDTYGQLPESCSLCLYSYANHDPILFTQNGSYNLSFCGDISYNASYGSLMPRYVIPKE